MDILLFALFGAVAIIGILIGIKVQNWGIVIIGSLGLVLLGVALVSGNVDFVTGKTITSTATTYGNSTTVTNSTEILQREEVGGESYSNAFALLIIFLGIATAVIYIGKTISYA